MSTASFFLRRSAWASLAVLGAIALSIPYLDRPIAYRARDLDPAIVELCLRITSLGEAAWYLVPLGVAIPALYLAGARTRDPARAAMLRRLLWAALFVFLAIALSGLLTDLLKFLFGRARPVLLLREGYSGWQPFALKGKLHAFPSGHATTVAALALALGLLWPRLMQPLLLLAGFVMLTRVAVGAHYLSDVIAGSALGVATTLWLHRAFARRRLLESNEDPRPGFG